jgi:hypothetical protein
MGTMIASSGLGCIRRSLLRTRLEAGQNREGVAAVNELAGPANVVAPLRRRDHQQPHRLIPRRVVVRAPAHGARGRTDLTPTGGAAR